MSKKDFIALADAIREHNSMIDSSDLDYHGQFTPEQLVALADFCQSQNPNFKRERWLAYIAGQCGPNGGQIK